MGRSSDEVKQGGDGDEPNSTTLFMTMQEMAFTDPSMEKQATRDHYQLVKDNKAFLLEIKQMYIWKIMCDTPKSIFADRHILDAVSGSRWTH